MPGTRVALNLHGVEPRDLARGDVLVLADQWHPSRVIDASLRVLGSRPAPLTRRGAHLLAIGSAEHAVRLRILGAESIAPGASGIVRIHLPVDLPLVPGDRFVLREAGRGETVGGGEVLEVDPLLPARLAAPDRTIERVVAERGWVTADELERRTGQRCAPTVGAWVVDPHTLRDAQHALGARLTATGETGIDVASLDEREHALLATLADVTVRGTRAVLGQHDPLEREPWLAALRRHLFDPPSPEGVAASVVRDLVAAGHVVRLPNGVHLAREGVDAAAQVIAALSRVNPDGSTVAQIRDALASSRRVVVPLLEHLEAAGITRREGNRHHPT
jgi:selenocysteine-specific elongation factor